MKIQCPKCKTVYQLDDKKIPNKKIKFKCRECQNPVYINKKNGTVGEPSQAKQMICPKCNRRQSVSDECIHCGTTMVNHRQETKSNRDSPPTPKKENETPPQKKQGVQEELVNCPKCSHGLRPDDLECYNCGIVIEKYKAFTAKQKQAENESQHQVPEGLAKSDEERALQ